MNLHQIHKDIIKKTIDEHGVDITKKLVYKWLKDGEITLYGFFDAVELITNSTDRKTTPHIYINEVIQ